MVARKQRKRDWKDPGQDTPSDQHPVTYFLQQDPASHHLQNLPEQNHQPGTKHSKTGGSGEDFTLRPLQDSMFFFPTHEVSNCVPLCASPMRSYLSTGIKATEPADHRQKPSKLYPKEPFFFAGVPPLVCVTVIDSCPPSPSLPQWLWCPLL